MKHLPSLVAAFLILLTAGLQAAPKINGAFSYQFGPNNATVTISLGVITNSSEENATGTILVQLWAMDAQYDGGRMRGHAVASYKLEGLEGDEEYRNFKETLKTSLPSRRGNYRMCITVSEYRQGGYVITDSRNLSKVIALGPTKAFTLQGPWRWKRDSEAGTITMQVAKIAHTRSGKTGSLRLSVWATRRPYTGGDLNGYQLGSVDKKALQPGYAYNDVSNSGRFKKPPPGTYHTSLVLMEYNGEKYVVVAHLGAEKTSTFQ